MMTQEDRQLLEQSVLQFSQQRSPAGLATLKLIYGLLEHAGLTESEQSRLQRLKMLRSNDEQTQEDIAPEAVYLLHLAFQYTESSDTPIYYTTGQLAKIFGVSTTTINNWIRDKRIAYPDMENKQAFKQSRIPDNAVYTAPNGLESLVREAAQTYDAKQANRPPYDEIERMKELIRILLAFEAKYEGNYEAVVARLGDPAFAKDWRWRRDADEWLYVIGEIAGER